jgi:hypothetical protein
MNNQPKPKFLQKVPISNREYQLLQEQRYLSSLKRYNPERYSEKVKQILDKSVNSIDPKDIFIEGTQTQEIVFGNGFRVEKFAVASRRILQTQYGKNKKELFTIEQDI